MRVARELLGLIERADAAIALPPLARAFVPPRRGLARDSEFLALQLADDSVGLAFALLDDTLERLHALDAGRLAGRGALELARGLIEDDPAQRALGLAAANAVTHCVFRRAGHLPARAENSFGSLTLGPQDRLGMVGLFRPLLARVRASGARLTVLERRGDLAQAAPDGEVTRDPGRLAACNKIVATSSALLNDSFEAVARHARHAEAFAIIGPSASGFPDPLFARGVDVVGGYWVADPQRFMQRTLALESWGDAGWKTGMRRDAYPGAAALLAEAARRQG